MQIVMMPTERLVPYARNARTHSDQQVAQIAASIAEFGFTNPILIGADDVIIAGHGRLMAAKRLGMAEVPAIVLGHLSEAQRRALVIADNKIALNAGWDMEILLEQIDVIRADGFDMDLIGFSDEEIDGMLAEFEEQAPTGGGGLRSADGTVTAKHGAGNAIQSHRIPDSVVRVMRHKGAIAGGSHPAVFPIKLAEEMLEAWSADEDVLYEPFTGSGSQLIAATNLGRACFGMELDPAYCDVAVRRWQLAFDAPAVLAGTLETFEAVAARRQKVAA